MEGATKEIMTVDDLATYLRCHNSTIYRLLKKRAIPAFKLGSDWRFQKAAIDRWAQGASATNIQKGNR